jgi:hypothetical protein
LSVASQAFILDRMYVFDGFRQLSTIGLGVGFSVAGPVCPGDGLRRATVSGLTVRSIDSAMLNHIGRIIVVTDNAGAQRADVRADRALRLIVRFGGAATIGRMAKLGAKLPNANAEVWPG